MTRPARLFVEAGALVVLATVAWGCADAGDAPAGRALIRVATLGAFNFGDLPMLVAHDRLRSIGYDVQSAQYAAGDLLVDALARGEAHIGNGALTVAWGAAARGAPVRTIMEHVANPHRLVVASGIVTCAGLHGRRLALHGEGGVVNALTAAYLAAECPGVKPEILRVEDSSGRAAALLAGSVDAAGVDLNLSLWLEEQEPGRFRTLVTFSERWPDVKTLGVHVSTSFAESHPDAVAAYVRARLEADRTLMADPQAAAAAATRFLGPSDRWPRVAKAYIDAGAWAPDGGLDEAAVARTLAFFANETLRQVSPADVAELRFLRAALAGSNGT